MDGYLVWAFLIAACAAGCTAIGKRIRAGLPILPLAPRRPVPWNGFDLVLVAAVYIGVYILLARVATTIMVAQPPAALGTDRPDAIAAVTDENDPLGFAVSLLCGMAANLGAVAFALLWIMRSRDGAEPADFGWRSDAWRDDVRLGLLAFAALAAPVYAMQLFLLQFVDQRHPIIEVLERQPSAALYALAGLSAVVVAPVAEEFFFRVLLQGWLESAGPPNDSPNEMIAPVQPRPLAILISASFFAALHIGQGAAPVPLFFLAWALGYIYQRTHRLLPCVIVHFCLNACSFALLCLS